MDEEGSLAVHGQMKTQFEIPDGRVTGQRAATADFVARPRLLNKPGAMAQGG
jgi:hypothetical protein